MMNGYALKDLTAPETKAVGTAIFLANSGKSHLRRGALSIVRKHFGDDLDIIHGQDDGEPPVEYSRLKE